MESIILKEPIVTATWLHNNLNTANLIILDATIPRVTENDVDKTEKQIPNTRFFDIKKKFSDVNAPFPNTVPSENQFIEEARNLGINNDSALVVYDDKGIYSSARVWYLFKTFSFNNVAVLSGGLPEWERHNFKTEQKVQHEVTYGNFTGIYNREFFKFFNDVKSESHDINHTIIDARSEDRFKSLVPEPRAGLRRGTIPNSKSLPFTDMLDNGCLKNKEDLKKIFKAIAEPIDQITFSCGSGITACVLALGAEIADYKNISVYDGSWTEYGSLITNAVEQDFFTKEELLAYILLYAAHSDFKESNHERNVIISKVDMQTFQKIHDEFDNDNDYQCIQKITKGIKYYNYDSDLLIGELKNLFFADGDFDINEQNVLMSLNRILKLN